MRAFTKGFNKIMKDLNKTKDLAAKVTALTYAKLLQRNLKEATPVDTGEAREGWEVRLNPIDQTIEVTNDVEHIKYLNAGSSEQAPAHFIEKTVLETPNLDKVEGTVVTYR